MIPFSVQTAILFALLYFVPILGDFPGQARMVIAGSSAVVASGVLMFLWDLATAPGRIHAHVSRELGEHHSVLRAIAQREDGTRLLTEAHEEGLLLYRTIIEPDAYSQVMGAWVDRTEGLLVSRFSVRDQLAFRRGALRISMHYAVPGAPEDWMKETEKLRWAWSGRLDKIIELIETDSGYLAETSVIDALVERGVSNYANYPSRRV